MIGSSLWVHNRHGNSAICLNVERVDLYSTPGVREDEPNRVDRFGACTWFLSVTHLRKVLTLAPGTFSKRNRLSVQLSNLVCATSKVASKLTEAHALPPWFTL